MAGTARAIALLIAVAPPGAAQNGPIPLDEPSWIGKGDYPESAVRLGQAGRTVAVATVAADGSVAGCRIDVSSGVQALDAAVCTAIEARARFTPARDAKGQAIASRYSTIVEWRLPAHAGQGDAPPMPVAILALSTGDADERKCFRGDGSSGQPRPLADCATLSALLPRARALSRITGPVIVSSTTWVAPHGAGPPEFATIDTGTILREVKTTYTVGATGSVGGCDTTVSGVLDGDTLRPSTPCSPGRVHATPGAARTETTLWRLMIEPAPRIPLRATETDIVLTSRVGDDEPICHPVVGKAEWQTPYECRHLANVVASTRRRTRFAGAIEAHFRSAMRYGATSPAPIPLPAGETTDWEWVRTFRLDANGRISDCSTILRGANAVGTASEGTRPCEDMPLYDRPAAASGVDPLWVLETEHYTTRQLSGVDP